jgi:hypothetical protein
MAPPIGSSRHKKHVLDLIKQKFQDNPYQPPIGEPYNNYMTNDLIKEDIKERFNKEIVDYIVNSLKVLYEEQLLHTKLSLQQVDNLIFLQPIEDVRYLLWSMVEIWALTYKPVAQLKDIVQNEQSVHTIVVLKATNEGIGILSSVSVVPGQKTLAEIGAAWLLSRQDLRLEEESVVPQIKRVIADMHEWGKKSIVMHKTDNVYRKVLRGLWAKIKGSGPLYAELVKRLWEECSEARGLCADGHVGRLVNVLVGFDEEFKSSITNKEYFQNNMSLIANSTAPLAFKIEQASKLMDELGMPEDERGVWLEAL